MLSLGKCYWSTPSLDYSVELDATVFFRNQFLIRFSSIPGNDEHMPQARLPNDRVGIVVELYSLSCDNCSCSQPFCKLNTWLKTKSNSGKGRSKRWDSDYLAWVTISTPAVISLNFFCLCMWCNKFHILLRMVDLGLLFGTQKDLTDLENGFIWGFFFLEIQIF